MTQVAYQLTFSGEPTYQVLFERDSTTINAPGRRVLRLSSIDKIFYGDSPKCELTKVNKTYGKAYRENTYLFCTHKGKHEYIFVGHVVMKFNTHGPVVKYVSPMGPNDVPYPYAVCAGVAYLMLEKVCVPYAPGTDPYDIFYEDESVGVPFNYELIHRMHGDWADHPADVGE